MKKNSIVGKILTKKEGEIRLWKKKLQKKISILTFLLIVALIAIIVMGVFIYKLNNEKTLEIQKSANLQEEVGNLNNTVDNLQSKIDTISATINGTTQASELEDTNMTTYDGNEYTFMYNKNWKDLGIATKDSVGSENRRVGALQLDLGNNARVSTLKHSNTTLNQYIEDHKKMYLNSMDEGGEFKLISEESYNGNSLKGYKIVFEQLEIFYVSYLLESNDIVYEIEYTGSESGYNSIKSDIEKTVNSFKIK